MDFQLWVCVQKFQIDRVEHPLNKSWIRPCIVITSLDISDMTKRNVETTKRQKAGKTLSYSLQKVLPVRVIDLNEFGECRINV